MAMKKEYWFIVGHQIDTTQTMVEALINTTPTSELRNKLTAVNIHLMTAKEQFEKCIKEARETDVI